MDRLSFKSINSPIKVDQTKGGSEKNQEDFDYFQNDLKVIELENIKPEIEISNLFTNDKSQVEEKFVLNDFISTIFSVDNADKGLSKPISLNGAFYSIQNMLIDIAKKYGNINIINQISLLSNAVILEIIFNDDKKLYFAKGYNSTENIQVIEYLTGIDDAQKSLALILAGAHIHEQTYTFNKGISHAMLLIKFADQAKYTMVDPRGSTVGMLTAPSPIPQGHALVNEQIEYAGIQHAIDTNCVRHCLSIIATILLKQVSTELTNISTIKEIMQQVNDLISQDPNLKQSKRSYAKYFIKDNLNKIAQLLNPEVSDIIPGNIKQSSVYFANNLMKLYD